MIVWDENPSLEILESIFLVNQGGRRSDMQDPPALVDLVQSYVLTLIYIYCQAAKYCNILC